MNIFNSIFVISREFWETASTVDNFSPSDFKDQQTVIMYSGKIWKNLQPAVTVTVLLLEIHQCQITA